MFFQNFFLLRNIKEVLRNIFFYVMSHNKCDVTQKAHSSRMMLYNSAEEQNVLHGHWILLLQKFLKCVDRKMDVNERVLLMNGIITYLWTIIGIVIQVQAFSCVNLICTVHYLKNCYFCTSSPLADQWEWLNLYQLHPWALCESSYIYVWLHQLSVRRAVDSCCVPFSHSFVETG